MPAARVGPSPVRKSIVAVDGFEDRAEFVGDLHAEDERQPTASMALWLAPEIMPVSATTVTPGNWLATMSENRSRPASSPVMVFGSRRRSLESPAPKPVALVSLEISVSTL